MDGADGKTKEGDIGILLSQGIGAGVDPFVNRKDGGLVKGF